MNAPEADKPLAIILDKYVFPVESIGSSLFNASTNKTVSATRVQSSTSHNAEDDGQMN